jgi:DNA repair exonuclease SbcCD nuclease subunit
VSSLVEPSEELLVRSKSEVFIDALKKEMIENATRDVQPLLCLVRLKDEEEYDEKVKEAYVYETIGGNNSREAMQQLLAENPELRMKKTYSHRLCSVYRKMSMELSLRLASKHNRAAGFTHDMTTWDKVSVVCTLYTTSY